jgi:hypothetical protein
MERHRRISVKAYTRAIVAISLIIVWSLSAFTGFLLWLAPSGPRAGRLVLLGLTKGQWGDLHFWFSVAALIVTLVHVAVDWRALRGYIRYITRVHRSPRMGE